MMMTKNTIIAVATAIVLTILSTRTEASSTKSPAILTPGCSETTVASGAVILPEERVLGVEISFRVGILPGLEIAAPMGLTYRLLDYENTGTLFIALGIGDIYFPGFDSLIYRPTAMVGGQIFVGKEATLRTAVDLSGAENGFSRHSHPVWLQSSTALLVDFGTVATLALGIAYQKEVIHGTHPPKLDRTGWAYDARISFGSVQVAPFSELPILSIHLQSWMDFIAISKIDINTDTGNRHFRLLMGLQIKN